MSRIDDLIEQLCPDGVGFKTLGELGTIFGGLTGKSKADFSEGNARFISYMNVFTNPAANLHADDFVRVLPGERQRTLTRGDILFTGTSETPGEVAMSSVITADVSEPLYLNSFCIGYRLTDRQILDPEFAKHLFRSTNLRAQLIKTASGVTRFNVSKVRLATVKIPVPPLEIQHQIVRILDSFTELGAGLGAELECRQLQYAHYRDSLLDFAPREKIRWAKLSDVATFRRGTAITAKATTTGDVPVIANAPSPVYFHNASNRSGETIVVARSGAYAGSVSFWDQPIFLTDAFSVHPNTNLLMPKFVYYLLRAKQEYLRSMKKGAGVPHVRVKDVEAYEIPVTTLTEQERIVSILDMFDALVNGPTIGITVELKARRKQYEHYRDRLLTFRELAA